MHFAFLPQSPVDSKICFRCYFGRSPPLRITSFDVHLALSIIKVQPLIFIRIIISLGHLTGGGFLTKVSWNISQALKYTMSRSEMRTCRFMAIRSFSYFLLKSADLFWRILGNLPIFCWNSKFEIGCLPFLSFLVFPILCVSAGNVHVIRTSLKRPLFHSVQPSIAVIFICIHHSFSQVPRKCLAV